MLALTLVLNGCREVQEPQFKKIEGFKIRKLGLKESEVGFRLRFLNPNDFRVNAKEAVVTIEIDGVSLGQFVQDSSVSIDKNKEFIVPFTGTIPMGRLLELNYRNLGERELNVRAKGSVKLGKAGVFVTRDIDYEGKHKLSEVDL